MRHVGGWVVKDLGRGGACQYSSKELLSCVDVTIDEFQEPEDCDLRWCQIGFSRIFSPQNKLARVELHSIFPSPPAPTLP